MNDWYMEYTSESDFDWDAFEERNVGPVDDFFDDDNDEIDFEDI